MNKLYFLVVPILLSPLLVLAGCSTHPSRADWALCGPRPTYDQARLAVKAFLIGAYGVYTEVPVSGIQIHKRGVLHYGLLSGDPPSYGWWITFLSNVPNAFGVYTGWCKTTVLWNAKTGVTWDGKARDCLAF